MKDGRFIDPCVQDILQSKIILTTMVTSLQLTQLKLQDCFSHILIDEAAQVCSVATLQQSIKIYENEVLHKSLCVEVGLYKIRHQVYRPRDGTILLTCDACMSRVHFTCFLCHSKRQMLFYTILHLNFAVIHRLILCHHKV